MYTDRNSGSGRQWLDRPLSARSVIASFLLGMYPPRARAAVLVRWCGLFAIAPGTARVALSRMVQRGELSVRHGRYELSGGVRARQAVQDFSRAPALRRWDGRWQVAVVTADERSAHDRAGLRAAMRSLRFAPQAAGVWTRPDNLPAAAQAPGARAVADAQCRWWTAVPHGDPAELAEALFELPAWNAQALRLLQALDETHPALSAAQPEPVLAPAFELAAAVVAHLRADPLLPDELLPPEWVGAPLRRAYGAFQPDFSSAVATWMRTHDPAGGAGP